jgi:hypothetical protein
MMFLLVHNWARISAFATNQRKSAGLPPN